MNDETRYKIVAALGWAQRKFFLVEIVGFLFLLSLAGEEADEEVFIVNFCLMHPLHRRALRRATAINFKATKRTTKYLEMGE